MKKFNFCLESAFSPLIFALSVDVKSNSGNKTTKKIQINTLKVQKMTIVTSEMYAGIARCLQDELDKGGEFFNGHVEYDTAECYATLTCTLIIYRKNHTDNGTKVSAVEKVVPVWWRLSTFEDGMETPNDFSWSELCEYLL